MAASRYTLARAFRRPLDIITNTQRCSSQKPRRRDLHRTSRLSIVKPFLLADIGEGTRECQIIQWFVQPGARVEQFEKICEVQSDKAATDITSPFDGVIMKLHYEADDMAIVGKPLVDIDIQGDITAEDAEKLGGPPTSSDEIPKATDTQSAVKSEDITEEKKTDTTRLTGVQQTTSVIGSSISRAESEKRTLATPAVRHLTKQLNVRIIDITGTGKDGRVTKEDVQRHAVHGAQMPGQETMQPLTSTRLRIGKGEDRTVALSPVQTAMFKTMTRSLTIPHFLYTSSVDMSALSRLRKRLNERRSHDQRLTHLPFILKAISSAMAHHAILNASLDTQSKDKPALTYRSAHNFGIAVDTPSGLLVPVIHHVENLSIGELADTIRSLSSKAHSGKLEQSDSRGGSFTVSNIGAIGGGVVAPIIVEPQVAIVGIGRSRVVPAFDERGEITRREELIMSWSADHRVVDGAECARAAEKVRTYLEHIEDMVLELR